MSASIASGSPKLVAVGLHAPALSIPAESGSSDSLAAAASPSESSSSAIAERLQPAA
jgi:hypothetical protein